MTKISQIIYLAASSLFLIGVTLQVFLAGNFYNLKLAVTCNF